MTRLLIAAAIGLAATTLLAHADPLPNWYLGSWCLADRTADPIETEEERRACTDRENTSLEFRRDGYQELMSASERSDCKFIAIKHTGEKWPASTKPRKEDWVPLVRVLARCVQNGQVSNELIEMVYSKGTLSVFMKRYTDLTKL